MPARVMWKDPKTLNWQERCAAASEVYQRRDQLFRRFMRRTTALAKAAHPATGGNECLCHNWGNEESRRIWHDGWRCWDAAARALDDRYSGLWADRRAA
jgi:hypothetical protein